MNPLSWQIVRASEGTDAQEVLRLDAQSASIQAVRDKIIMKIAEVSVAPSP